METHSYTRFVFRSKFSPADSSVSQQRPVSGQEKKSGFHGLSEVIEFLEAGFHGMIGRSFQSFGLKVKDCNIAP